MTETVQVMEKPRAVSLSIPAVIGFCCGAFDCLHPGHILMLADAAGQCDRLYVGLHTNPHIERAEKNAPIQTIDERIIVLQAIKYVYDIVTYTTELELADILYYMHPDVRIIGSDWRDKQDEITAIDAAKRIHWHERGHTWSSSEFRRRVYEAEKAKVESE